MRLLERVQLRSVIAEVSKGDVTLQELLEMMGELSPEIREQLLAMTLQEITGGAPQLGPPRQVGGDRRTGGYMAGYGSGPGARVAPVSPPTPHLTKNTAYARVAKVKEPQKFETSSESEIVFTCPGCGVRFPLGTDHVCAPKPEEKPTPEETAVSPQKEPESEQKSTEQDEAKVKEEKKPTPPKAKKP